MTISKPKIRALSFHHRIREGASHLFNTNHFLGIDPLDHAYFREIYHTEKSSKTELKKKI
jgi:hypothetical protein